MLLSSLPSILSSRSRIGWILVPVLVMVASSVSAVQTRTTTISLTLVNTYSGALTLVAPQCLLSGVQYINYNGTTLRVSATAPVTFTLSGSMTVASTGSVVSGSYTDVDVDFLTGQTGHSIMTQLMRGTEWFNTPYLSFTVDETPPNAISVDRPRTYRNDTVGFSRDPTLDALPVSYRIVLSVEPSFSAPITIATTATGYLIPDTIIPEDEHIIYRYVEAVDCVGNAIASTPGFFYYNLDFVGGTDPVVENNDSDSDDEDEDDSPVVDDTIYEEETPPNEEIPFEEAPIEEQIPEEVMPVEDPLEHLAAPWWSDWLPFANDQPPVYASKVLTPSQRQAAKLLQKLKNAPFPLDYFNEVAFLPDLRELPQHGAAFDPLPQLIWLIKSIPAHFDTTELYQAVELLLHIRYLGLILLIGILGYDVERVRLRLVFCDKFLFYMIKIGHLKKNTL